MGTALMLAIQKTITSKDLIKTQNIDLNATNHKKETALMCAMKQASSDCIKLLIDKSSEIEQTLLYQGIVHPDESIQSIFVDLFKKHVIDYLKSLMPSVDIQIVQTNKRNLTVKLSCEQFPVKGTKLSRSFTQPNRLIFLNPKTDSSITLQVPLKKLNKEALLNHIKNLEEKMMHKLCLTTETTKLSEKQALMILTYNPIFHECCFILWTVLGKISPYQFQQVSTHVKDAAIKRFMDEFKSMMDAYDVHYKLNLKDNLKRNQDSIEILKNEFQCLQRI